MWNDTIDVYEMFDLLPVLDFFVMLFLVMLMIFCYMKLRVFYIILLIYLFSIIIGVMALSDPYVPFTPYFQVLFILFQTMIFFADCLDTFSKK